MNTSGLPAAQNTETVEYHFGYNPDIIRTIEKHHNKAADDTKEFAQQFEGDDLTETCYNVWNYAKSKIPYKEDDDHQKIKSPSRAIEDAANKIPTDCKTFAHFCCSVLSHFAPVAYRYVSFDPSDSTPTHVYCIVKKPTGRIIIVDPVWHYFDEEKSFQKKKTIG